MNMFLIRILNAFSISWTTMEDISKYTAALLSKFFVDMAIKIKEWFYFIFLLIDGLIFTFIKLIYDLFLALAKVKLLNKADMAPFIRRVYMIIGVVMLFLLAYSLLKTIVDVESKEKTSTVKTVFNVVKTIILLALVPTIFEFAINAQNAILNKNTIGQIILGENVSEYVNGATGDPDADSEKLLKEGGMTMALNIFKAFLTPVNDSDVNPEIYVSRVFNTGSIEDDENPKVYYEDSSTYEDVFNEVLSDQNMFKVKQFAIELAHTKDGVSRDTTDGTPRVKYYFLISSIAGIFTCYALACYVMDLGIRVVKLAFYELIAPIPIIANLLPGSESKGMLKKWISVSLKTYAEVFIRIAILYFAMFLITLVVNKFDSGNVNEFFGGTVPSKTILYLSKAVIIMGIIAFIKKAPDYLKELGLGSGDAGFGLRERLKQGGLFAAAGMAAGGITTGIRNLASGVENAKNKWKEANEKNRALDEYDETGRLRHKHVIKRSANRLRALGSAGVVGQSVVAGFVSGAVRSHNKDASSLSDVRDAAHTGAIKATDARDRRDARQIARSKRFEDAHIEKQQNGYRAGFKKFMEEPSERFSDYVHGGPERFKKQEETAKKIMDLDSKVKTSLEEIMSRDISYNDEITGTGMSLKAMEQHLSQMQNKRFEDIAPKKVMKKVINSEGKEEEIADLQVTTYTIDGKEYEIKTDDDLSKYTTALQHRFEKTKKDVEKAIKQAAFKAAPTGDSFEVTIKGADGTETPVTLRDLKDGEVRALRDINNIRKQAEDAVKADRTTIEIMNKEEKLANINEITDGTVAEIEGAYEQFDKLVGNMRTRTSTIARDIAKIKEAQTAREARKSKPKDGK